MLRAAAMAATAGSMTRAMMSASMASVTTGAGE